MNDVFALLHWRGGRGRASPLLRSKSHTVCPFIPLRFVVPAAQITNPMKKGYVTYHSCHRPTCKRKKWAQLCTGHPLVTATPLCHSRSCLRSTNAYCTKGQSPSYRVKLSQQAGCRQRTGLLASWTPSPAPFPPPFQAAKTREELPVKTVWCAGTVSCG